MQDSSKKKVIELLLGAVVARAIYVAAELGIADLIKDKPSKANEIAEKVGAHAQSLYRLMRMLSDHGFFHEDSHHVFSLTEMGECLASDTPHTLRDHIRNEDETRWRSIGKLKTCVVEGIPAFDKIFGKSYFEYIGADPKMNTRFEAGMSNLTVEEDNQVASLMNTVNYQNLVDVGGGRGGFIAAILKKNPSLKGVLFELPHVVFPNEQLLLNGLEKRCEIVSGSFFETVPKGADIYTLKRVLHDWDDQSCEIILKKCREAMNPQGKVVVVEAIVPSNGERHLIKDVDVYMMALFSGRERTESEFSALFEAADLKLNKIIPTESELSILEASLA